MENKEIEILLKQIGSALKKIKKITIDNNQLIGFCLAQSQSHIPIPEEWKKSVSVSTEQLDYMMRNNIPLNQWGDS